MKKLMTMIALIASVHGIAATSVVEFDQAQEVKCHSEIKTLGCLTSAGEENIDCVETKKTKLSNECREIHGIKQANR